MLQKAAALMVAPLSAGLGYVCKFLRDHDQRLAVLETTIRDAESMRQEFRALRDTLPVRMAAMENRLENLCELIENLERRMQWPKDRS